MSKGKFLKDLAGHKYGRLTVVSFEGNTKHRLSLWKCTCECGVEVTVIGGNLKTGTTKSCGCFQKEESLSLFTTHGMTRTPTYDSWQDMLKRCKASNGKGQANYAARGITVHEDFRSSFTAFHDEVGARPDGSSWSVGRICNNTGYTYGNLRWEQPAQQARNKTRYSNNKTGVAGVSVKSSVSRDGSVYLTYTARCSELDKTQKTKTFSGRLIGSEMALEMAKEWRIKAIARLNADGAGYAESHGSEK